MPSSLTMFAGLASQAACKGVKQMSTLRDELNETIKSHKITDLNFLRINDWSWVLKKLADAFLSHGKNSLDNVWLWDSIKEPYKKYKPEDCIKELMLLIDSLASYYLIVTDEDGKYWVLDGKGHAIITALSSSRLFEYYITNKDFSWLLCENHHGIFYIKKTKDSVHANA